MKYGFIGLLQFTYNMLDIWLIMYKMNLWRLFQLFLFSFVALIFLLYSTANNLMLIINKFSIKISIKLLNVRLCCHHYLRFQPITFSQLAPLSQKDNNATVIQNQPESCYCN